MQWRPEIHFERRLKPPRWLGAATPPIAVIVALAIGALVLWASGRDPVDIYQRMVRSAFTNPGAFSNTLIAATPLLLTGLAAAMTFRMKVWNIGADGQLMIGAVLAAAAGTYFGGQGLAGVMTLMILAGIVGGCVWAAIAALLRVYMNTNEVLTTLMLNYIAPLILFYLIFDSTSYWRDLSSQSARVFPQAKTLATEAFWPEYGTTVVVPFGFILGAALAARALLRRAQHPLRLPDESLRRQSGGRTLCGHPHRAAAHTGHAAVGCSRRHRRGQPDRRCLTPP